MVELMAACRVNPDTLTGADISRPCISDPNGWDLDHGGLPDWLRAIRGCQQCPFRRICVEDLFATYPPGGEGPHGMIQAGIAFTSTGRRIPNALALAEYASAGNQRRRTEQAGRLGGDR